jgi:peptidoglycan/LPS O-acetylase OafA/YrhL
MSRYLFYSLGVCFGDLLLKAEWQVARPLRLVGVCGLIWLGAAWATWSGQSDFFVPAALPAAFAGTAAVILIARDLQGRLATGLANLGRHSMAIYVTHVLFVAGARILLVQGLHIENLSVVLPSIFLAGVFGPLAAYAALRRMRLQHAFGLT